MNVVQLLTGPFRGLIMALVGAVLAPLVTKGLLSADQATQIGVGVIGVLVLAWSFYQNWRSQRHTQAAIEQTAQRSAASGVPTPVPPKPAI